MALVLGVLLVLVAACDLDEVLVTEPVDRVVAEAYVVLGDQGPRAIAFLHRTAGHGPRQVADARIVLSWNGGEVSLNGLSHSDCVVNAEIGEVAVLPATEGSCYGVEGSALGALGPGDEVTMTIELPGGGRLDGTTGIPGAYELLGPPGDHPACRISPETALPLTWTSAAGAWAYSTEALIFGLSQAQLTLDAPDPLFLLGLSISASDTTLVFPRETGIFERFDLDRAVSLALQEGLPQPTFAVVTVAALDRNYVNWIRGGNFNPSGEVRVPSLFGDGTGVLGSAVHHSFRVDTRPVDLPSCVAAADGGSPPRPGSDPVER